MDKMSVGRGGAGLSSVSKKDDNQKTKLEVGANSFSNEDTIKKDPIPPVSSSIHLKQSNTMDVREKKSNAKWFILAGVLIFIWFIVSSSSTPTDDMGERSTTTTNAGDTSATQQANNDYTSFANFTSDKGNFSIYFEGSPRYQEGSLSTEAGEKYPTHLYQYQASDESVYQVFYTEYPPSFRMLSDKDALLAGVNGTKDSIGGEIVSIQETTYQGFPAVQYVIYLTEQKYYFKAMNVLNGKKMYSVVYIYDDGKEVPTDKFFGSLIIK